MLFDYTKKYDAKIMNYGIQQTKAGAPQVSLQFSVIDEHGVDQKVYWRGSLSSAASLEMTTKTLATAGFKADELEALNGDDAFEAKDLTVTLEEHEYEGKTTVRVKFVNAKGGMKSTFTGALPKIAGQMKKARNDMGIKVAKTEDMPF